MLTLVPGVIGGSETYARSLARALAEHGTLEYRALVPILAPDAGDGLETVVVREYRAGTTPGQRIRAMARASARSGPLRAYLSGLDVVHFPLTVPVPPVERAAALTLHDVQHRDLPKHVSLPERSFRALAYDRPARRAAAVIVPSAFVRARAIELLGLQPKRVHVIHHGIDHDRFTPGEGPREPFLLYPAKGWPHKNHPLLFEAFARVRRERPELRLVLTGHEGEAPDGVDVRGLVPADELLRLYRCAACLVFPSLYEGFGQPLLEAMACGCPVAASNTAAIPEICGNAAVLFDPYEPDAIAAGVLDALERTDELRELGIARSACFTWAEAAHRHEAVYRSLGGLT